MVDPENWTTKTDRLEALMVQMEGVRDGSETTKDRVVAEGEGGIEAIPQGRRVGA